MLRNDCLQFRCQWTHYGSKIQLLLFATVSGRGQVIRVPIAHGEGHYYVDAATLAELEANRQVVFRSL